MGRLGRAHGKAYENVCLFISMRSFSHMIHSVPSALQMFSENSLNE